MIFTNDHTLGNFVLCFFLYSLIILEVCLTKFSGTCQKSTYVCNGGSYTHDGFTRLCSSSTDICCIGRTGQATTIPPNVIPTAPPTTQGKNVYLRAGSFYSKIANQAFLMNTGPQKMSLRCIYVRHARPSTKNRQRPAQTQLLFWTW